MNQNCRLHIEIDLIRYPGQQVLRLHFYPEALSEWCLGLCLLKEGLVEALTVTEQRPSGKQVRFILETQLHASARVTLTPKSTHVALTKNNLDHLQHFFLKYYRDSVAEVDHLDLQATDAKTGDQECYITFRVQESKAPMTPEQARRRLRGLS